MVMIKKFSFEGSSVFDFFGEVEILTKSERVTVPHKSLWSYSDVGAPTHKVHGPDLPVSSFSITRQQPHPHLLPQKYVPSSSLHSR